MQSSLNETSAAVTYITHAGVNSFGENVYMRTKKVHIGEGCNSCFSDAVFEPMSL